MVVAPRFFFLADSGFSTNIVGEIRRFAKVWRHNLPIMKNNAHFAFLFLLFFLSPLAAVAQSAKDLIKISDILRQTPEEIPFFDTAGFGEFQVAIRFPYGSARILNAAEYDSIKTFGKVSVSYIYTQYTQSQPNQKELDRDRYEALRRLAPDLFNDPGIHWETLVQTAAVTADSARRLFHGFVITYQPPVSEARKKKIKGELDMLVDCAKKRPPDGSPQFPGGMDSLQLWLERNVKFPKDEKLAKGASRAALIEFQIDTATGKPRAIRVSRGASIRHNEHIKTVVDKMPPWTKGEPGIEFAVVLQFTLDETGKSRTDCGPLRGYRPADCKGLKSDSVVMKVMDRNKNWKKMLVVEDVTGSMMPYIADLLLWNALKGNLQNTAHFVFFNDGDRKSNYEKEIGKTGGIYHAKPKNVDALEDIMLNAIVGGEGGDTPENDIEAILEGIKQCPECEEVVLIADNSATPRDLELLDQVSKPVHVVLCGIRTKPNPAHLLIAWKTKGSLHTIKEDITNLAELQEGNSVTVMGKTYKIVNGRFMEVGKM